jgi:hypothetical protein
MCIKFVLKWTLILVGISSCVLAQNLKEAAINQIGRHKSPHRVNVAILELQEGDALRLVLDRRNHEVVEDVTGIAWMTDNLLVYSVSPIYGKPGIFKYDYRTRKSVVVVKPVSFDSAYPDGADFFQLQSIDSRRKHLFFYYGSHVDSIDFKVFQTPHYLFRVNLEGNEMVRAKQ